MKHIIKVEVLENLPETRPLLAMDTTGKFFQQKESPAPVGPPNNEIWYTSSDGNIVTPYSTSALPEIVSNTYSDGKGVIKFKTDITNIGMYAFRGCTNLTSVTIPNSVKIIGSAFYNCTGLTSIVIPNSVTNIAGGAFQNCSSLTSITIGNSVKNIGDMAFYGCYKLASIDIPNSVTSIGDDAFHNCSGLTAVTIGNSVTSIGDWAFENCESLISITIPNSVTSIGNSAFMCGEYGEYEGSLEIIIVGENEFEYDGSDYFSIVLGDGTNVDLIMWTTKECLLPDTEITLSDGSKKQVKDITYDDKLKVWNFDEGHYDEGEIAWLTKTGLKNDHYYQLTFSDGTILKTTGKNSNHKVYCTDTNKFEGVAYIEVGAHVFTENGIVTITDKQYIEEEVEYYNLITKQHFNCFANGVLTSDRYGNIYPISDNMIFIKNDRPIRPYSEFEAVGIKRYWYDTLRLGENTETINETKKYITKLEAQMRPIE